MKFTIITHAEHKIHEQELFAYEPYVKEMNLWLKYVDEVKIVAPFSKKELTSIESKYNRHSRLDRASHHLEVNDEMLKSKIHEHSIKKRLVSNQVQHDETGCHPEPVEGSHDLKSNDEMLNQVQHDVTERHSALDAESHDLKRNVKSLRQAQTDSAECHPEPVEGSHAMEFNDEIATSHTPRNDNTERHSAPDAESHDMKSNDELLNQVQHDETKTIHLTKIQSIDITSLKNAVKAIFKIPFIIYQIYKAMQWADHIHLRCPGNIGLLGCFVQVLFPHKPKTVKYAGNWDPKSKQPYSYKLQKWMVSNTFLTRNCKVLVYGEWSKQSSNIMPFFTASYSEKELLERHSERSEAIFSKDQITTSLTSCNDDTKCHPEPFSANRHSALDAESHDLETNDEIATSHTPRNDNTERHSAPDAESYDIEKSVKSLRQAQTDNTECHPEPVEGSHDMKSNDEMLNQVQHDESERHPQPFSANRHSRPDRESHDVEGNNEIATSHTPRNDNTERHSAPDAESYDVEGNDEIATSPTCLERSRKAPRNDSAECHPEPVEGSQSTNLKFIYVGGFTPGKQPLLSVQVVHQLKKNGYSVQLDMYGDGVERINVENYILVNDLKDVVFLLGNTSKEIVKKAYQQAHFLVFISKSEGWPKVVAEAMFWGCLPITSNVSCIPSMLDFGKRGSIVNANSNEIISAIETYLQNPSIYKEQAQKAMDWSRQYTLEKFEEEIGKLFHSPLERG